MKTIQSGYSAVYTLFGYMQLSYTSPKLSTIPETYISYS